MATNNASFPYLFFDEQGNLRPYQIERIYPADFTVRLASRFLAHRLIGTPLEGMMFDIKPLDRYEKH